MSIEHNFDTKPEGLPWDQTPIAETEAATESTQGTPHSENLGLEKPSQEFTTPPAQAVGEQRIITPDSPADLNEQHHRWLTPRRIIGSVVAAAVVVGGSLFALSKSGGEDNAKHKPDAHSSAPLVPGGKIATSPATSTEPTAASPTAVKPTETAPVSPEQAAKGRIDLTTVLPSIGDSLNVSPAVVPEYNADPSTNPTAAFNAFLADYSYYLSTPSDANAKTARYAITEDSYTLSVLNNVRQYWQNPANKLAGSHLYFWNAADAPLDITTTTHADGTLTLEAKGELYYKPFTDSADGTWEAPNADQLTTDGAIKLDDVKLTYAKWDPNSVTSPHTNLLAVSLNNQKPTAETKLSFPTYVSK